MERGREGIPRTQKSYVSGRYRMKRGRGRSARTWLSKKGVSANSIEVLETIRKKRITFLLGDKTGVERGTQPP